MIISDYKLMNNIEILFQKPLVLFEVKNDLKRVLRKAGIDFYKMSVTGGYNAVIETNDLSEYIEAMGGDIFTSYGVKMAIAKNIRCGRFSYEFQKEFLKDEEIWMNNYQLRYISGLIESVLEKFPEIMIYTVGKVGSSTMQASLEKANIPSIQVERFYMREDEIGKTTLDEWHYCLDKIKGGIKIITLVRDPIARDISGFMQTLRHRVVKNDKPILEQMLEHLSNNAKINYEFEHWFEKELFRTTEIDVYQYPFDKEKGYGLIKKNKFEILLLTLEKLNSNVNVIQDFVGATNFKLIGENVGEEKEYKYLYAQIKKDLKIPYEIIEKNYENNSKLEHFYTLDDITGFRKQWEQV